jgi:Na+-transporting methylmalonyl-CoA/oxaloacetate decarboxylase gamma subunit
MIENILYALEIMGKGMGSIFAVIILLTLIVSIMGKITTYRNQKKSQKEA